MNFRKTIYALAAVAVFTYGGSMMAWASQNDFSGPGLASGDYMVTVDAPSVNINVSHDSEEVLVKVFQGQSFTILEDMGDGWLKVKVNGGEGYLPLTGNASITEGAEIEASEKEEVMTANTTTVSTDARRQNLVNYALQFVGNRYVYGGNDPHTGADCSGFTRYVMQHGAGVGLNRSSGAQANQGVSVSADQMRPGDLIFYGNGSRINHVAMYIGNGQIVHASTYKTGIKISNWNYRTPVKIKNMLGD